MSRKSFGVFALFAVICVALGSQENCEEKTYECKKKLMVILEGHFTDEELCQEIRGANACLRKAADECLGEDEDPDVEKALKEFANVVHDNCHGAEVKKCLDDNEDYLDECVTDIDTEDISQLQQEIGMDPKFIRCHLYQTIAKCIVGRSLEKCGAEAADKVSDLLSSVQEHCEGQ